MSGGRAVLVQGGSLLNLLQSKVRLNLGDGDVTNFAIDTHSHRLERGSRA